MRCLLIYFAASLLNFAGVLVLADEKAFTLTISTGQVNLDGVSRIAYTINGQTPGPTIHVNVNDSVKITVKNRLHTESISIHWHGVLQHENIWMDGVSYITQYPIPPFTAFTYSFVAGDVGTHWYHSHSGAQYADGMFGAFIIHDPNDEHRNLKEEVIILNEWHHRTAPDVHTDLSSKVHAGYFPVWIGGLVNGKGRFNCSLECPVSTSREHYIPSYRCQPYHDYTVIAIKPGEKKRLRIISSTSGITFLFSIDNHRMTVIAVDGEPVTPYIVHRINIYVSQTYDVLLEADQTPMNYWIRGTTLNEPISGKEQILAILHYDSPTVRAPANDGSGNFEPTTSAWSLTNTVQLKNTDIATLKLVHPRPMPTVTLTHTAHINCSYERYHCAFNGVSFQLPPVPVALASWTMKRTIPATMHMVDVNLHDGVLFIINNDGDMSHPFHLHGHKFFMIGVGPSYTKPSPFNRLLHHKELNWKDPILRDSFQINSFSWAVLLFNADNPGMWLFHCHIEWHLEAGLAMLFRVAPEEMPDPPFDFPVTTSFGIWQEGSVSKDLSDINWRQDGLLARVDPSSFAIGAALGIVVAAGILGISWFITSRKDASARTTYHPVPTHSGKSSRASSPVPSKHSGSLHQDQEGLSPAAGRNSVAKTP